MSELGNLGMGLALGLWAWLCLCIIITEADQANRAAFKRMKARHLEKLAAAANDYEREVEELSWSMWTSVHPEPDPDWANPDPQHGAH